MQCAVHFLESGERRVYLGDEPRHLIGAARPLTRPPLVVVVGRRVAPEAEAVEALGEVGVDDRPFAAPVDLVDKLGGVLHDVGVLVDQ